MHRCQNLSGIETKRPNSISRHGKEIKTPDFWAYFRLEFNEDIDEYLVAQLLESGSDAILSCEVNPVIHQLNEPNDPLFPMQVSLGMPGQNSGNSSEVGMNVEDAWEYYTGSEGIKIGIFDDVVFWGHEDLGNGSLSGSVVKGGYDFVNNLDLEMASEPAGSHGTAVAGIIGAKRNNGIGISGIAGGDIEQDEQGVTLYSMGIFSGSQFVSELSTATQAIVEASYENPEYEYGYGLHIQNHSWGTYINSQLLEDAIHFAWRNNSILVGARGNTGSEIVMYPACYEDVQIINVGGCNDQGELQEFSGTNAGSNYGMHMDVLAPANQESIWSTIYFDEPLGPVYETSQDVQYSSFNNTSAAAAHVSGVCALAYQACIENELSPLIPFAEDLENVMQSSCRNSANELATVYDPVQAWGWLDAHEMISKLSSPFGFLHHFLFDQIELENIQFNAAIQLESSFDILPPGSYQGERMQFTAIETFEIPEGYSLAEHWPVYGNSTGIINSQEFQGNEHDFEYQLSIQGNTITVQVSLEAFHVTADSDGNANEAWIPASPEELAATVTGYFSNPNALNMDQSTSENTVSIYPNPCQSSVHITWLEGEYSSIQIFGSDGKEVMSQAIRTPVRSKTLDLEHLPIGAYKILLKGRKSQFITTIIKT